MGLSDALPKLKLLIPRLATDNEGELASTVFAIQRILKSNNTDFHDLAASIGSGGAVGSRSNAKPKQEKPRQSTQQDYNRAADEDPNAEVTSDEWAEIIEFCLSKSADLPPRERDFISGMPENLEQWGKPTMKQGKWIMDIFRKAGGKR